MKKELREKKHTALLAYERAIILAASIRKEEKDAAQAKFKEAKDKAKAEYRKTISEIEKEQADAKA